MAINPQLGEEIAKAIEDDQIESVVSSLRSNELIVLQQCDEETGEPGEDEDGNFNVVLAEMDDEVAVLCFTDSDYADKFAEVFSEQLPDDIAWPKALVTGSSLLDGLPGDCGLLLNPGSEYECYFPAGSLDVE